MIGNLPDQWAMVRLGTCLKRRRETVMPATIDADVVNVVGLEDIEDGGRGGIAIKKMRPADAESLKTRFYKGDILYGKLRPYLNKVGITLHDGLCSTEIWAFVTESFVEPYFVYAFLSSPFFVERVSGMTKGANLPRLDLDSFEAIEIPVPPLSEQRRIVQVLREAEESRSLRQASRAATNSILPAMFEDAFGDLLRHPERHNPTLLGELLDEIQTGWSPSAEERQARLDEWGVLKLGAVTSSRYLDKEHKALPPNLAPRPEIEIKAGDLLLTRKNTKELVGTSAFVWETRPGLMFSDLIFRLKVKPDSPVHPKWLWALFSHPSFRPKLSQLADGAAGSMPNIPKSRLAKLRVPIPGTDQHQRFIAFLDELNAVISLLASDFATADGLTLSLQANAFSGELTRQWREKRGFQLEGEAASRDHELEAIRGVVGLSRAPLSADFSYAWRHDGAAADLTRDLCRILDEAAQSERVQEASGQWVRKVGKDFTSAEIANTITGPLHNNIHAVEANLAILVARGLVMALSREQRAPDTDETVYGNCYRLAVGGAVTDQAEGGESPVGGTEVRDREILRLLGQGTAGV